MNALSGDLLFAGDPLVDRLDDAAGRQESMNPIAARDGLCR
jgi:hypothetical protein